MFNITTHVSGNGAIQYIRFGDTVTFSVIADEDNYFVEYIYTGNTLAQEDLTTNNGDVLQTNTGTDISATVIVDGRTDVTPFTITLINDIDITAVFEENRIKHITADSNIVNAYVYVSNNDEEAGYTSTLFARPYPGYEFIKWSDGNTSNPRTVTVTNNITYTAIYQKVSLSDSKYQYRCYVKDQLHLTDPPKAFMVVNSFDVRTDKLTRATSTIRVYELDSNINEGDVLVLYNPKGDTLYTGVINSISDLQITCSQMASFYKGNWIYNVHPSTYLEEELAWLLGQYAQGKLYQSSYTDNLVAQRLGGITVQYTGSTTVNLPTDTDEDGNDLLSIKDMETFIYEIYEKYGIDFVFEINFSGANYVRIRVPNYTPLKIGDNMYAIQNMTPTTKIEENNRLVIFAQDKTYRATYVATKNGIVANPVSIANRFNITNTVIVFSDDELSDLVAANLPQNMYNHKVEFDLMLNNFIYQFDDFNLGGTLEIFYGDEYFNTVLTGYEINMQSNQNITSVHFICGLVRQKLTQLLTLGKV